MNNPADAALDSDEDGYTNIEEYINDLDYFVVRRELTSLKEIELEKKTIFYQLTSHLYFSENVDAKIYSTGGVLWLSHENVNEIYLEGLERGIYILKVKQENGDIHVSKILF